MNVIDDGIDRIKLQEALIEYSTCIESIGWHIKAENNPNVKLNLEKLCMRFKLDYSFIKTLLLRKANERLSLKKNVLKPSNAVTSIYCEKCGNLISPTILFQGIHSKLCITCMEEEDLQ